MAASVIKEQHNERRHLGLFWSQNLENWVCAGLVASGCADNAARHYATLAIDGEDLLILSRSGDANACTAQQQYADLTPDQRFPAFRHLKKTARNRTTFMRISVPMPDGR